MSRALTTFILLLLALVAFAANSVFARLALLDAAIGPWSYSFIRLCSGALVLLIIVGPKSTQTGGSWKGAFALVVYAVFFSYAYLMLGAGTGALILFAVVQLTMLSFGFLKGERLDFIRWFGFGLAISGLIYLMAPSVEAPSLGGSLLMAASGLGWGIYSILGQKTGSPIIQTSGHFSRAVLILLVLSLPVLMYQPENMPTLFGISLAVASGALTSAVGYVIWYRTLKDITLTQAAISQLSVPVIAALGGMVFISEPITLRFFISSMLILIGIAISTLYQKRAKASHGRLPP